jgi:signal transduction histidine kinase
MPTSASGSQSRGACGWDAPDLVGRDFDEVHSCGRGVCHEIVRIAARWRRETTYAEQIERRLDRGVTEYYSGGSIAFRSRWRFESSVTFATFLTHVLRGKRSRQAVERRSQQPQGRLPCHAGSRASKPAGADQGAAQVLKLPGPSEQNVAWSIDVIERQVAHLSALIDDLLDVSRITRGKIELKKEVIELSGAIASAVEANRALIDLKQQRLSVDLVPVVLSADGTRVTQIVSNLLNNASKYTPERGSLSITSRLEDGMAVVKVKYTGPGIPDTLLPHVFDGSGRALSIERRAAPGIGLRSSRAWSSFTGAAPALKGTTSRGHCRP